MKPITVTVLIDGYINKELTHHQIPRYLKAKGIARMLLRMLKEYVSAETNGNRKTD